MPDGSCPTVGIAGLSLGGGIGVLARKLGLTCDRLTAARVVTADTVLRTASEASEPDLFWALRGGGGGNLGIVTSFIFATAPASDLTVFSLRFPAGSVAGVLGAWQEWAPAAPDELWSNCIVSAGEPPACRAGGCFAGSAAALEPLLDKHFVTANDVYNARAQLEAQEAAVRNAASEVKRAQSQLGQHGDINARLKAVEAEVADAKLNVEYCSVRAPFDGYVTNLNIAVGQYANEGRQVVSLVDDRTWYVIANFRENFLPHIADGMTADIFVLAYPNHRFRGRVQGVGWALYQENGATIDGLPSVEPTLNWVRLSQRFPVRLVVEDRDPDRPLRMGATAVVTIQGFR
jgi:FAD/FMN-containing dehydrogenase